MGASSRPHDYNKSKITPEETVKYFNDYLEKWRVAMAGYLGEELTNFNLVGHSFGGFVSAQYALAYPQHIRKLLLLSPIGIYVPSEEDLNKPI